MLNWARAIPRMDVDPAWLLRIFTVIPAMLILLAGAAAIWIYFFALSLLPQGQSLVDTPGLSAEVSVVRDSNGVPGIIGEKEEDVALVLGYVMAQDRLWQMDYFRKAGQGRLAEILGAEQVDADHLMRTVRARMQRQSGPVQLTPREKKWIEQFVLGINRYISAHEGKLPVEFSLLEYHPSPFTIDDVESIIIALAWASSSAIRVDPAVSRILARLGGKKVLELLPEDPGASVTFVPADLIGWKPTGLIFDKNAATRSLLRVPGFRGGCACAVGPNKSSSGKPVLGCAMYQGLAAPGFWYRARLVIGDFCITGAFIPGVPVALAGSNGKLTWGAALMPADDADLFLESCQGDGSKSCRRVDRWRKCEELKETYRIKGGASVSRPLLLTDIGPVVSDVEDRWSLSLRWTGQDGSGLFQAFFSVNRAQSGTEARGALRALIAPCLNVVWADDAGNFGIQAAGRIPIRAPGSDGIVPSPAWTGVHDWVGFIPFEDLPSAMNPAPGFCATTDARPGGPEYPLLVSCYWNDYGKNDRIGELLAQTGEHNRESFQKILNDTVSPLAKDLIPVLLGALGSSSDRSRVEQEAMRILSAWDFQMNRDSAGAAVYGLVYQALAEELLLKDLGQDLFDGFAAHPPLISRTVRRVFIEGRTDWLRGSDPRNILAASFRKGIARGKGLLGGDPGKWKWGEIHKAEFRHPLTARSRFLEALYDVGPFRLSGADDTLNFSGWSQAHPFGALDGVSLRQVADMTEPPAVYAVNPLGISAHFFSSHYKDQTSAWAGGRSFPDPTQATEIRKGGVTWVRFKPASPGAISKN